MANKGKGIIALALAGIAYWIYKLKPEQKENIKNKINEYGNKAKEYGKEALDKVPTDVKEKLGLNNKTEDINLS